MSRPCSSPCYLPPPLPLKCVLLCGEGGNLAPVEFHRNSTGDFHWAHGTPVEFRVHFSGPQRHWAHDAENHMILRIPCLRGGFRLNNPSLADRLTTGEWQLERGTAAARRGQSHGSSNSWALRPHSVSRSLVHGAQREGGGATVGMWSQGNSAIHTSVQVTPLGNAERGE